MTRISIPFTILTVIFCVCFIIDSFLEIKVVNIFNIPMTTGFLIITISYIVNDCIVEIYGYHAAKIVIWLTFTMHIVTVSLLQIACYLPADKSWYGNEHFCYIFSLTPRITIASMLAFIFGSSVNAYIMSKLKITFNGSKFKARAFLSTVAGEIVDALIFFPIAFIGILPYTDIIIMGFAQAIGKIIYETIMLPITTRIVNYIKLIDNTDIYDKNISYNIFL